MKSTKVSRDGLIAHVTFSKNRHEDGLPAYAAGKCRGNSFMPLSPWVETFEEAETRSLESARRFMSRVLIN